MYPIYTNVNNYNSSGSRKISVSIPASISDDDLPSSVIVRLCCPDSMYSDPGGEEPSMEEDNDERDII